MPGYRTWFKVWADETLDGKLRPESPALRGIFVDVCAMACGGRYGDDGLIKLAPKVGMTDDQICIMLNLPKEVWLTNKRRLEKVGSIKVDEFNIISIKNWKHYQSEYQRQKSYRKKVEGEVEGEAEPETPEPETPEPEKKETPLTRDEEQEIRGIFDYWQTQGIVEHKTLAARQKKYIKQALKDYSVEDIKESIHTYAQVINTPKEYWFEFRWAIEDFMQRGIEKFLDKDVALKNYRRREDDKGKRSGSHRGKSAGSNRAIPKDETGYTPPEQLDHTD